MILLSFLASTAPNILQSQSPVFVSSTIAPAAGSETFVLVSGFMGGVGGFKRLEQLLTQQGHRVISIDPYRLSADSADVTFAALAKRIDNILTENEVQTAVLVGHSHGGGVVLRLAALNPARASAAYLIDVGALSSHTGPIFSATIRLVGFIARLPGGKSFIKGRIVRGLRESSGNPAWIDAQTRHAYTAPYLNDVGRVVRLALRLSRASEPTSLSAVISGITVPVTVLLGDAPHTAGPVPGELDALHVMGSRLSIQRIAGGGHFLHEEAPQTVAMLLRARTAPLISTVIETGGRRIP